MALPERHMSVRCIIDVAYHDFVASDPAGYCPIEMWVVQH